jgi:uncharacterized cupredoxin-like copper-binding protein
MKSLHPSLAILLLLPLLASCGSSTGQASGGSPVSCTAPALAGNIIHVDLADAGGGMMGGGGMRGSSPGSIGGRSVSMMPMTLHTDLGSVAGDQPVSFVARNNGSIVHELIVLQLPAGTLAGSLPMSVDQKVSESAIRGEVSKPCGVGAGGGLGPGATGWVKVTLPPGAYALVCNLSGHYAAGMWAEFAVR